MNARLRYWLGPLLGTRRHYRTWRDWLRSAYCQLSFRSLHWARHRHWPVGIRRSACAVRRRSPILIALAKYDRPFYVRPGCSDADVLAQILIAGEYDFVLRYDPGVVKQVVDLGANVGIFARWVHDQWPEAHVVCVEPDEHNVDVLRQNLAAGRISGRTTVLDACVAAERKQVAIDRTRGEWGFRMTADVSPGTTTVSAITVPDVLDHLDNESQVDILKCDVEGAEAELFRNCHAWIERCSILVVETHAPYSPDDLMAELKRNGSDLSVAERIEIGWGNYVLLLRRSEPAITTRV